MPYKHKEAFCLMQYRDEKDEDAPIEWLWNSRDGVTPFMVAPPDAQGMKDMLQHMDWECDICAPLYVPNIGQRVFIDLNEARARERTTRQVDTQWDPPNSHIKAKDRWPSKEAMFEDLLPGILDDVAKHHPDVVVCTPEMQRVFIQEREERRKLYL